LVQGYQVPAERITVIPPGVNVGEWTHPGRREPGAQTLKILFVGGNFERKGGAHLLEAFRALYQGAPFQVDGQAVNIELHLVTRDLIPEQPGVTVYHHMQPNSPALKQLYFDSHIFCLPTFGDCLPMVLSEAGASGLPLVSTQVAAIPEIVLEGENGFLTAPGDTQALYTALQQLILDPELRQSMGERAVQTVSQAFDAKRNTARLVTLLKEIADSGRMVAQKVSG
jgi:glycosyltransferase involved in cell wall biosynthesis